MAKKSSLKKKKKQLPKRINKNILVSLISLCIVVLFAIICLFLFQSSSAFSNPLTTVSDTWGMNGLNEVNNRKLVQTSDGTLHLFTDYLGDTSKCLQPSPYNYLPGITWFTSSDKGKTWVCHMQLTTVSTNSYASAVVDSNNNIYVTYSSDTNNLGSVYYRKLTQQSPGQWSVGAEQVALATVPSQLSWGRAVIELDGSNRLWLAVHQANLVTHSRTTVVYYSDGTSDSPTWQNSIILDTPTANALEHIPVIVHYSNQIAVLYQGSDYVLSWRYRNDADPLQSWNPQQTVTTLTNTSSPDFQAAVDNSGNIHVVYSKNGESSGSQIRYVYYNGSAWSSEVDIDGGMLAGATASITTDGNNVYVFYGSRPISANSIGINVTPTPGFGYSSLDLGTYAYRVGSAPFGQTNFTPPHLVNTADRLFDKIYTYSANTNQYIDQTSVACTTNFPVISQLNDVVYFGHSEPFRTVTGMMTTAGVGGSVVYEYWNGTRWTTLQTPYSMNNPNFTRTGADHYGVMFTPPTNWQRTVLDQTNAPGAYFYIRARVVKPYLTRPIESCFWDFPEQAHVQIPNRVSNGYLPLVWQETVWGIDAPMQFSYITY